MWQRSPARVNKPWWHREVERGESFTCRLCPPPRSEPVLKPQQMRRARLRALLLGLACVVVSLFVLFSVGFVVFYSGSPAQLHRKRQVGHAAARGEPTHLAGLPACTTSLLGSSLLVEKPAKASDTSVWARRRLQQAKKRAVPLDCPEEHLDARWPPGECGVVLAAGWEC